MKIKFHGCPCIQNRSAEQIEKWSKWLQRKAHLEKNGYEVKHSKCCEWNPYLKRLQTKPETVMGRILYRDNEVRHIEHVTEHVMEHVTEHVLVHVLNQS